VNGNIAHGDNSSDANMAVRPSPVDTGRGLSVLYRERYLYSRYDPVKATVEAASALVIPDETLVLCASPLLCYGLDVILEKLPPTSYVLALECDEELMAFSAARIPDWLKAHGGFSFIRTSSVARVLETVDALKAGPFRRCIRVDLSGGAALYPDFYRSALCAIDEYISRWWRNHVTLMKLGRNYARNFFFNCSMIPRSFAVPSSRVSRPILVAGAGPSLDASLDFIKEHRERLFLLAVDTALPTFRDSNIEPDAVIIVESQFWITRAFIGFRDSGIPVYADMTSNPQAIAATGGPVHYFNTRYAKAAFLERFASSGFAPPEIQPLGSVGLSALALAEIISTGEAPVFFSGLDFSWGSGFTHSRGAPSIREAHASVDRYCSLEAQRVPYAVGVTSAAGKDGRRVFTDPALSGYAALCAAEFGEPRGDVAQSRSRMPFFDIGVTGLPTGCRQLSTIEAAALIGDKIEPRIRLDEKEFQCDENRVREFLARERSRLVEIRGILTGSDEATGDASSKKDRLERLIAESDFLFLHFPDGYRGVSAEPSFLKRIRIELEYFLKTLDHPRA